MVDINFLYKDLIKTLLDLAPFKPDMAIVLGSGLGDFAQSLDLVKSIDTGKLQHYPTSAVPGHKNRIHFAKFQDKNLLLFQGRIHFYEGYALSQCILPVHIAAELSSEKILLTNAAGGINPALIPGSLMLNSSFVSFNLKRELTNLIGLGSMDMKNRFLDFPSSAFNSLILKAADQENIKLHEGVYWYTKGPAYETPAEVRMIYKYGGDAVGMSTVHEAVFACCKGMETASISCITNYAAGISHTKLSHNDVTETANKVHSTFEILLKRIIMML